MKGMTFLFLSLLLMTCCKSSAPWPPPRAAFQMEEGPSDAVRFRDLYHAAALRRGYSEEEVRKQIFLPTRSLMQPSLQEEPFGGRFASACPSHLYDNGIAQPVTALPDGRAVFEVKGPVTIIFIPGIFGEFVENLPFEMLFRNIESSFYRKWSASLAAISDEAYSVNALKDEEYRLSDLVKVTSLDDEGTGKPLVNLIFLYPPPGSLETMGELGPIARRYLDRLDKVFRAIPEESTRQLVLLGYSRGAPVALELLVRARADVDRHPWAKRIKGMMSMAGVLYGSGLADRAFDDEDSADYKLLTVVKELADSLEVDEAGAGEGATGMKLRNTERWVKAAAKIAKIQLEEPPPPPGLKSEPGRADVISFSFMTGMLKTILFDMFDIDQKGEYFNNVRRFKVIVEAALVGTEGLTTDARLDWWRKNAVPEDVTYFALTGTMADMTRKEDKESAILESPYYGPETVDYPGLRKSYYALSLKSGVELNDSQVTVPKACFWPDLSTGLNPAQEAFKAHFMGVLGTHHWGVAFPAVAESHDNKKNPFPRAALLEAAGAFMLEKM